MTWSIQTVSGLNYNILLVDDTAIIGVELQYTVGVADVGKCPCSPSRPHRAIGDGNGISVKVHQDSTFFICRDIGSNAHDPLIIIQLSGKQAGAEAEQENNISIHNEYIKAGHLLNFEKVTGR